jgi:hypothetical protein
MVKKLSFVVLIFIIFLLSFGVRALPLIHKGYVIENDHTQMVLARNLAFGLGYRMETKDGVILAPSLVRERAMNAPDPYFGTSLVYALLFKIFGFQGNLFLPMIVTLLAHALITVLLFLLAKRLFGYLIALIFVFFDIFLPITIHSALMVGFYEFASLFFAIGLLFYLFNKNEKPSLLALLGAGLFFTFAVMSRNAFLFSYGALVVYEFYKNRSFKRALVFLLPIIILVVVVVSYAIPNNYASGFIGGMIGKTTPSFQFYSHFFPDPYTYHYDQEGYFAAGGKLGPYAEPFHKYGQNFSLAKIFLIYIRLLASYIQGFLDLLLFGGPLIALLLIFGFVYLYQEKKNLFNLSVIWFLVWFFSFVVLTRTDNWTHYLELEFIAVLIIALGLFYLLRLLWRWDVLGRKTKYFLIFIIFVFILFHLVQANKWMLHENYRGDRQQTTETIAKYLKTKNLTDKDVIAVGISHAKPYALNYFTNLNFVYFDESTLKRLLAENRLSDAFGKYGVNKILGYTPELSKEIVEKTGVENLASHIYIPEEQHIMIYGDK